MNPMAHPSLDRIACRCTDYRPYPEYHRSCWPERHCQRYPMPVRLPCHHDAEAGSGSMEAAEASARAARDGTCTGEVHENQRSRRQPCADQPLADAGTGRRLEGTDNAAAAVAEVGDRRSLDCTDHLAKPYVAVAGKALFPFVASFGLVDKPLQSVSVMPARISVRSKAQTVALTRL